MPGPQQLADLDWRSAPALPGVVLIEIDGGEPYLGRTRSVRRRLQRLLKLLGDRAQAATYELTGSPLETDLVLGRYGRLAWPEDYRRRLRLRPAPVVKAHLANEFPRTSVTTRLRGGRALYFGPFLDRVSAERFEQDVLDFFGVRRCVENLEPAPEHPGCVWGEMGKCLRPCQAAVSVSDYRRDFGRLLGALESGGTSLAEALEAERDRASEELEFEKAAALHEKTSRARKLFRTERGIARDLDRLHGVAVQRAAECGDAAVTLLPLYKACWQPKITLTLRPTDGRAVPLDRRVREALEATTFHEGSWAERQDSLSLLRKWRFSSTRQGELIEFETFDRLPYRRLVNAVSRVAQGRPETAETQ